MKNPPLFRSAPSIDPKSLIASGEPVLSSEITLRDLFAMAAIAGAGARQRLDADEIEWHANQAYEIADAMIEARENRG